MKSFVNEVPYYRCALFGLCIHIFKKKQHLHFKIYHLLGDMRHFSTAALFSDTRTYTYLLAPPGTMTVLIPRNSTHAMNTTVSSLKRRIGAKVVIARA
jgi:hypothetical protein